jgi:hypothetical protein
MGVEQGIGIFSDAFLRGEGDGKMTIDFQYLD